MKDPFLPLDAEFWNDDRTRYTVFFDPGRQKRGIAPIAEMGRSLTEGKSYTLVVDAEWRDGNGLPLKEIVSRARSRSARPTSGRSIQGVEDRRRRAAGTRDAADGRRFPSRSITACCCARSACMAPTASRSTARSSSARSELTWSFTPREPWKAGPHHLVAFAMLEDLAGNRIGRAFEVDQFDRTDKSAEPEKTLIPFIVK